MPKTPMDYSNCCIYKIEHIDDETLLYVGHTTNFSKRKGEHKNRCNNENANSTYNLKLYQMIRKNGGFEMFKMIEVEKYPCKDRREAGRREDEIMTELKASMNMIRASRTQKQYYEDNKEKIKEYHKEYYEDNKEKIKEYCENNKEKIKEYHKEYCEKNKEKIKEYKKEYCEDNKEMISKKHKGYYQDNKAIIKDRIKQYYKENTEIKKVYHKEYRQANKDKLNEKVNCECGCEIVKTHLKRHQATKKHIDIMNKK
jgi:hypothetical protein